MTTEYLTTITTEQDLELTDGWDIALALNGFEEDPDAWITRADGIRLAIGTDIEDIEDEDGETIGQRIVGITYTEWETDEDGTSHDIGTDGEIIEEPADIADVIDSLTDWAASGAATPTRILAELMSDDTLDAAARHDDCEDITWQSGLLDSPHELSTGLIVTRTDGTTREVVIEFEVDKHDQVSRWRVDLFDEGNLLDTNGLTDDGWRWADGEMVDVIVDRIQPAAYQMIAEACDLED